MGMFDKFPKPPAFKPPKPPAFKAPVVNPANGMIMIGGMGGRDLKGNLYGQNKKSLFSRLNPFSKNKF